MIGGHEDRWDVGPRERGQEAPARTVEAVSAGANFVYLLVSQAVYMVCSLLAAMRVAQVLGPVGFGQINLGLALVSYVGVASSFGLTTWGCRAVAQDPSSLGQRVRDILLVRSALWILSAGGLGLLLVLFSGPPLTWLYFLYALSVLPSSLLLDWAFKGIRRMGPVALSTILQSISYLLLVIGLVRSAEDLAWVPTGFVISCALGAASLWLSYRGLGPLSARRPERRQLASMMGASWPLAATGLLSLVIYNGDTLLLGVLRDESEVGYYSAAYKVVYLFLAVIYQYFAAAFPVLSRAFAESGIEFSKALNRVLRHMIIWGLGLALACTFAAGDLIHLIFGPSYGPAATCLTVLIWGLFLIHINSGFAQGLIASGRQKSVMKVVFFQAAFVVLANLPAIHWWGAVGAAGITVAGELLSLVPFALLLRGSIRPQALKTLVLSCVAGLMMSAGILLSRGLWWPLSLACGGLAYGAVLVLTKGIAAEDWAGLRQAWRDVRSFRS